MLRSIHQLARIGHSMFLFLFLALATILLSGVELFSNFGTGLLEKRSCEIILKLIHQLERRGLSKFVVFSIFSL